MVVVVLHVKCGKCDVVRSRQPASRVAITEQTATVADDDTEGDDDDEYEDVEEDDDRSDSETQPSSSLDSQAVADAGASNLSMIMEQSYMDADFNLCLSGMHCYSHIVGCLLP